MQSGTLCIAIPGLHRHPGDEAWTLNSVWNGPVLRLCPGLPESRQPGYLPLEAVAWPLSEQQSMDYLRQTEELLASGMDAGAFRAAQTARERRLAEQREALEARNRLSGRDEPSADPAVQVRLRAQCTLLLAWSQEERLAELEALASRIRDDAARLRDALGSADMANHTFPDEAVRAGLRFDWRTLLQNMALFLPDDAVLCCREPSMIADLKASGLCRHPLPHPQGDSGSAQDGTLVFGETLPLWRLLGLPASQPGKPWLDVERLCLVCPEPAVAS